MDDRIKKLRIREIDVRIDNLKQNIEKMQSKIKELSDRKSGLISENMIYDKLHEGDIITSYSRFIEFRFENDYNFIIQN
jgi:hypothetical protein